METSSKPRTAVISCRVLEDEIAQLAKELQHVVLIEQLPQGLHNDPHHLHTELQATIDRIEKEHPEVQAIALGYGLCCKGTEGITTKRCLVAVPRAHDCITLLLGGKDRYAEYVKANPGTYWYSPGWNRHHTPPGQERYEKLYAEYVQKYGEDNAEYLMESEQHWFKTYNRATYVSLDLDLNEQDLTYTRKCADWLKWAFDHQTGSPGLLLALLNGDWDEERFVVIHPGQTVRMVGDDRIIEAVPVALTVHHAAI